MMLFVIIAEIKTCIAWNHEHKDLESLSIILWWNLGADMDHPCPRQKNPKTEQEY